MTKETRKEKKQKKTNTSGKRNKKNSKKKYYGDIKVFSFHYSLIRKMTSV